MIENLKIEQKMRYLMRPDFDLKPLIKEPITQVLDIVGHVKPGGDISAHHLIQIINQVSMVTNMRIFRGPFADDETAIDIKTPDHYDAETARRLGHVPEDINIVARLGQVPIRGHCQWDDSMMSVYIYPNYDNFFTVHVYTCKSFDASKVLRCVYDMLCPEDMSSRELNFSLQGDIKSNQFIPYRMNNHEQVFDPEKRYLPDLVKILSTVDLKDEAQVIATGGAMEGILFRARADNCDERLAASLNADQQAWARLVYDGFEVGHEERFSKKIITGEAKDYRQYPFQPRYERLIQRELQLFQTLRKRFGDNIPRIGHIGFGFYGGTLIELFQQIGIPVTGFDINSERVEIFSRALAKMGLLGKDKINVVCMDGEHIDFDRWDAIIVSAMVPRKSKDVIVKRFKKYLQSLDDSSFSNPKMIVRRGEGGFKLLYEYYNPQKLDDKGISYIDNVIPLVFDDTLNSKLIKRVWLPANYRR